MFSDEVYGMSRKREYDRARYKFLKENGFCVKCGGEKTDGKHVKCLACRLQEYENQKFRHKPRPASTKWVKYKKNLYYKDKEAGICVSCRTRKAVQGKTRCKICAAKRAAKQRAKRIAKPSWMCLRCSERAVEGYKHCQKHLELIRGYAKMGNARITELRKIHVDEYAVYKYWEKRGKLCKI